MQDHLIDDAFAGQQDSLQGPPANPDAHGEMLAAAVKRFMALHSGYIRDGARVHFGTITEDAWHAGSATFQAAQRGLIDLMRAAGMRAVFDRHGWLVVDLGLLLGDSTERTLAVIAPAELRRAREGVEPKGGAS